MLPLAKIILCIFLHSVPFVKNIVMSAIFGRRQDVQKHNYIEYLLSKALHIVYNITIE